MKQIKSGESGTSMVEFALVLPILAVLLFGIIQYGFIFAAYITVRNASSVGARAAIFSTTNAATTVAQRAVGPMLDYTKATATCVSSNLPDGSSALCMQVSYPLPIIIPYVVPGHYTNKTLTATTFIR